jgi:phage terminase small subunit
MAQTTPKLTERQLAFVNEYAVDRNGTQAAIRAGYSKRSAKQTASRSLTKDDVRVAVDAALSRLAAATETSSEWVRRRLKQEGEDFETGNPASRVRAVELVGRLNGDFVEDRRNARLPLESFGTAQLQELERALAERISAAGVPDRSTH